ncbi:MAG TPA: protein-L-isoaspartate(D-aspartate) O-methyltransferase [Stellaceae bacterium]|nr:protein-L-isoaspartate(D-aspartate) O-methyltransferase [Stellaceae bacterium]
MKPKTKAARLIAELRAGGIRDERVLAAIESVPREFFVPAAFQDQAYENTALPIAFGQTISQPLVVALMTEALEMGPDHKIFEVGTGSGYQTAVLAGLCRRVFTMERHYGLFQEAERRFRELRLHNVTARFGDGTKGWPEQAPFDRILVTAAAAVIPESLTDNLGEGGVLVMPVGEDRRDQRLVRLRREPGGVTTEELGAVRFVPLVAGLPRESTASSR